MVALKDCTRVSLTVKYRLVSVSQDCFRAMRSTISYLNYTERLKHCAVWRVLILIEFQIYSWLTAHYFLPFSNWITSIYSLPYSSLFNLSSNPIKLQSSVLGSIYSALFLCFVFVFSPFFLNSFNYSKFFYVKN